MLSDSCIEFFDEVQAAAARLGAEVEYYSTFGYGREIEGLRKACADAHAMADYSCRVEAITRFVALAFAVAYYHLIAADPIEGPQALGATHKLVDEVLAIQAVPAVSASCET